jgi:hypothetical protein
MNQALFRLALVCCLVGASSLCFHRFACDNRNKQEPGPHLLPEVAGQYLEEAATSIDMETLAQTTQHRTLAKHAVVTELLAGRLTLREAAARFRELNADDPNIRDRLAQVYQGDSYEVALFRNVIEHARSEMRLRAPEQVASVVARLEAELQEYLECDEDLCLP